MDRLTRWIVSYKKSEWVVVYDGGSKSEAWSALVAESAKVRTLVCMSEASNA